MQVVSTVLVNSIEQANAVLVVIVAVVRQIAPALTIVMASMDTHWHTTMTASTLQL